MKELQNVTKTEQWEQESLAQFLKEKIEDSDLACWGDMLAKKLGDSEDVPETTEKISEQMFLGLLDNVSRIKEIDGSLYQRLCQLVWKNSSENIELLIQCSYTFGVSEYSIWDIKSIWKSPADYFDSNIYKNIQDMLFKVSHILRNPKIMKVIEETGLKLFSDAEICRCGYMIWKKVGKGIVPEKAEFDSLTTNIEWKEFSQKLLGELQSKVLNRRDTEDGVLCLALNLTDTTFQQDINERCEFYRQLREKCPFLFKNHIVGYQEMDSLEPRLQQTMLEAVAYNRLYEAFIALKRYTKSTKFSIRWKKVQEFSRVLKQVKILQNSLIYQEYDQEYDRECENMNRELLKEIEENLQKNEALEAQIQEKQGYFEELSSNMSARQKEEGNLESDITAKQDTLNALSAQVEEREKKLRTLNQSLEETNKILANLEADLKEKREKCESLNASIQEKESQMIMLEGEVEEKQEKRDSSQIREKVIKKMGLL